MRMRMVAVLLFAVSACSERSPVAPSGEQNLATTPSAQAPVIRITVEREPNPTADGQIRITVSENLNRGLPDELAIDDWNGAKIRIIRRCDGRESFVLKDVQSGDVDPVTRKGTLVFTQVNTCGGSGEANHRFQAFPFGSAEPRSFTFPRGALLTPGFNIARDSENGHYYVRGKL